ncbi:MAG: hypothetical protein KJ886_05615 [Candidatus Thermoplasmatota archaeon]|nr:hypothetical protein [Candidatus Thermoplasmatota archaeon]MBU4255874.1 hypothetical protein [Candidatus Thermoplasmatota archaeon]MCG2826539.1 hypothetical protein [Thermoplasmatales archaeon]
MTETISIVLTAMGTTLVTAFGLVLVTYHMFCQRFIKPDMNASYWKLSKEEKWIRGDLRVVAVFTVISVTLDFISPLLESVQTFPSALPFVSFTLSLFTLFYLTWYACELISPHPFFLAILAVNADKYDTALENANNALKELKAYTDPEKRYFNPLKWMKKLEIHGAFAIKGRAIMGLAKTIEDEIERKKQYMEAIVSFNKALEFDKKSKSCLIHRGMAHGEVGDIKKASEDFSKARELNKKEFDRYYKQEVDEWMRKKGIHIDF